MYYKFFTIRVELVPPNPKEFDKNVSNVFSTLSAGILSFAESSSGFSKFMLGAINPFFIINIEYIISLAPAIHISCPVIAFVEVTSGR